MALNEISVIKSLTVMAVISLIASVPYPSASAEQSSTLWGVSTKLSSNKRLTSVGSVSSVTQCCIHCLRLHPSCTGFCYDENNSACYVTLNVTTTAQGTSLGKCYQLLHVECPVAKGYQMLGDHCVQLFTESRSYQQATERCVDDGGHLYYIKSVELDKPPLLQILANISPPWSWLGADDLAEEGRFLWTDGTPVHSDLWQSGEPSGIFENATENCAAMWDTDLNDSSCNSSFPFVCQID